MPSRFHDSSIPSEKAPTEAALGAWYRELRRQVISDVMALIGPRHATQRTLLYVIDGGGAVIQANATLDVPIQFPFVITGVSLLSRISGTATLDLQAATMTTFPTSASICGPSKPSLNGYAASDFVLAGWTKTRMNIGETLSLVVQAASNIQKVTVGLRVRPLG